MVHIFIESLELSEDIISSIIPFYLPSQIKNLPENHIFKMSLVLIHESRDSCLCMGILQSGTACGYIYILILHTFNCENCSMYSPTSFLLLSHRSSFFIAVIYLFDPYYAMSNVHYLGNFLVSYFLIATFEKLVSDWFGMFLCRRNVVFGRKLKNQLFPR